MQADEFEVLVRRLRRVPVTPAPTHVATDHERDAVERILPHRDPFLFVDRITGVDLCERRVSGRRALTQDDPVFAGHFPGDPVYPGVLLVEAIGQLGLCLAHFSRRATTGIAIDVRPLPVRAIKIHHAVFCAPVRPGDDLALHAEVVEMDDLTGIIAGQACRDGEVAAVGVLEVYFVEP